MAWNSKVVWSEGMFLRPQHFQQQDRYIEALITGRCGHLRPYDWGVKEWVLDQDALALGKVALAIGRGILPDGTPFNFPHDDDPPAPLDIDPEVRDTRVLLALPFKRPGMTEVDRGGDPEAAIRYRAVQYEVRDAIAGMESMAPLEIGKRRLKLMLDRGDYREYACIGVARIVEKRADGAVVLDDKYLPPCLDCRSVARLAGFLTEILGLLHQCGEALAGLVSGSGRGGVAEIATFLLLQVVNRFEPLFAHLATMQGLHPEDFYKFALQLAGELSTFNHKSRRPAAFPPYSHDDLQKTFTPVMVELRESLSMVPEPLAIHLPLEERQFGIRVSPITDRNLLETARFILVVNADLPPEILRNRFPSQVKIGSVRHIRELVNLHLPGIGLHPLSVAPRQLPYHAGATYFELDRSSEHWKQLTSSGGFALHVAGQFPGMELAFWAIRE